MQPGRMVAMDLGRPVVMRSEGQMTDSAGETRVHAMGGMDEEW